MNQASKEKRDIARKMRDERNKRLHAVRIYDRGRSVGITLPVGQIADLEVLVKKSDKWETSIISLDIETCGKLIRGLIVRYNEMVENANKRVEVAQSQLSKVIHENPSS